MINRWLCIIVLLPLASVANQDATSELESLSQATQSPIPHAADIEALIDQLANLLAQNSNNPQEIDTSHVAHLLIHFIGQQLQELANSQPTCPAEQLRSNPPSDDPQKDKDRKERIREHAAGIIGGAATIIAGSRNPQAIGCGIATILANVINIIGDARHKTGDHLDYALIQRVMEHQLQPYLQKS